ncbi:S41 family peptidase [Flavobacteriaceae bacterium F08102]|nr:S41 family peptidase [Flavobacteriaceae bacterium F08102]
MKLTAIFLFFLQTVLFSQVNPLIHHPVINNEGNTIAFSYQGDIFIANATGQNIKRLTIHEAYDGNPIWNPDGKSLYFSSNRFGNNDIFSVPITGGVPTRLTYHSASDVPTDITNDGQLLFMTRRNFVQVERESEINSIDIQGGTPTKFLSSLGFDARMSPNGNLIAFTRGYCRIEREAYRGAANRDIWVYNIKEDKYHQITTFDGQDFSPYWGNDQTLYFQSARSGVYNIHKVGITETGEKQGEVEQISSLQDLGLFSFNVSKNGKYAVMNAGDQVWTIDLSSKVTTPINIAISSDYRFDPTVRQTYRNNASRIALSPSTKYVSFEIRGEIFLRESNPQKSKTVNLSNSPARDMGAVWLNDETLIFLSDRDGDLNIYSIQSTDPSDKNLFTSLKRGVYKQTNKKEGIIEMVLSPDKKRIAFIVGNAKLVVANIDENGKISSEKTLLDGWDKPSGLAWSPDSQWLAYSKSDLYFNDEVYIHKADNSMKPINVSMHPKADQGPVWSPDGTKLGFSSNRNNNDHDVWFVWLTKKDWEKTQEDWEESESIAANKSEKDKKQTKNDDLKTVHIDIEGIHERQRQVTSFTGGEYLNSISKDGKTFYYITGNSGRGDAKVSSDMFKISWKGDKLEAITKGNSRPRNVILSPKNDFLYYISNGSIARIKPSTKKKESLSFNAKMMIDYRKETEQIFEEAWKVIRDRFYDPNHHQQNWESLKKKYKPLALKASTRVDFKGIFNRMLGQINASHMGMARGEDRMETQRETTGILGLELKNEKGKLVVSKVVANSAADREVSTLLVGDVIKSVNGEIIQPKDNLYQYLADTGNEKILLGIVRNGKTMEITIRPKTSARADNYNAWVKERKALTEKYSNGRLGYIHIQGMNWTSFEQFERELTAAGLNKEGIVIDVRFNGGGWTTDYLMAVLSVKQHAYTVPRGAAKNLEKEQRNFKEYYPFSERLPLSAWTKPSIALCNQFSYSNAEIFSHAYKELNIGKLVGVPTFGAVISTGSHTLIDGTTVRVPFRGWYVKSTGENMDFTPATPDIIVYDQPDDKSKGVDTQLKAAVEELLKEL